MNFSSPLITGTLVKRYKRFLADITLDDGQHVTAHCPNTGAMSGCAEPGYRVLLSPANNPKRKLAYTWEIAITQQQHWIGINTHNANRVVESAIQEQRIEELSGYTSVRREVKYGTQNSKIDFLLSDENNADCYVEVKSVTLLENNQGYFPDAKTARGTKHLEELIEMVEQGSRAVLLFCVQHTGIDSVAPATHIDPLYSEKLHQAAQKGVEILAYSCLINEQKIQLNQRLKVIL